MVLLLTAIDVSGETRDFSYHLNTLESGFDLLNQVVAMGHTLVKAQLLEQGTQIDLPTTVFNVVSFAEALQELEGEWNMVLREPTRSTTITQARIDFAQWQLEQYENWIVNYELFLTQLMTMLDKMQTMQVDSRLAERLIQHYQVVVDKYRIQLINAHLIRHQLLSRLDQLGAI